MKTLLLTAAALAAPASPATLRESIAADMPQLMTLYRDLHANPELSMQEVRSPAKLAGELRKLGFRVTEKVGKTGVVAVLANGPGKTVLIRADMDALPVVEQTGLPFASKVRAVANSGVETGVMHACGHDTHMTAFLGTARRLAASKGQWSGTLVMILQPGEETSEGAKAMLADGLFTRFPKPDVALAFHDSATLPAGAIGVSPGYVMANVDSVDVLVKGVGSHGAAPQNGRDPIVLASRIVTSLQTLVSRERNPLDPSVVTVGSFHAGATHNIIPDEAKLQITVRSYTPEVRKALLDGIARVARGEAIAAGMPEDRMPVVTVEDRSTPSTMNTEAITARTAQLFTAQFGAERVKTVPPSMVGEDFGRYRLTDPRMESLIFWVGGVPQAKWDAAGGDPAKLPSLHSPFWAPDAEKVIGTGVEAMTVAALDVLKRS
ncbi:amidohydrolase [Sphingomonas sp. BN140010]|uniref:Amidohydrolase n=1 Tax=Sphingomonas arvum TaxID=2992113 RepID=A0ABT3JCF0_9SPHN|nr:amidohydrolase [Sphingomonas sp. BN140010]MCW3796711.1 amidohydrolase [Sphingomonas sp. BN140010]